VALHRGGRTGFLGKDTIRRREGGKKDKEKGEGPGLIHFSSIVPPAASSNGRGLIGRRGSEPGSPLLGSPFIVNRSLPFFLWMGYTDKPMIVSMIQIILKVPGVGSVKDKRRVVKSLKDRLWRRFKLSAAEVDLQDSLSFAQIGGALVSNSRTFGEAVLNKALKMIEDEGTIVIQDVQIHSEEF
jgi:uncharacterized protein YlxP (DUF503 family)